MVTLTFFITLFLLSFNVIVYFLGEVRTLNVFALAVSFGVAFFTTSVNFADEFSSKSLPSNVAVAV